jgi:hypothetical protein
VDQARPIGRRRDIALTAATGAAIGLAAVLPVGIATARDQEWLALQLEIPRRTQPIAADLRATFGATGDGVADDAPAFQALAAAVNSGQVPPGAVVTIPEGTYRVVGDSTVTFRRPVILRGSGAGKTIIQIEYAAQRSVFMRAQGEGMYAAHSTAMFNGRQGDNRHPNAPFSPIVAPPADGDRSVMVERPDLFAVGDDVYVLCDDYGDVIHYTPTNSRSRYFLLKQHAAVTAIDGQRIALDTQLRHEFGGASPRLYRWRPNRGFAIEHMTIRDAGSIADTEEFNTFRAVFLDGVVDGWVWGVHFENNTSTPLTVGRGRRVIVTECVFAGARHVGGGGNGYLPELYYADDCLVEYSTSIDGRHALICNWSCWGNVFRYNRVRGTQNTETHGEYCVENLYFRNDARGSRMEIGGGGDRVHAHDGPRNQLLDNYARTLRILKPADHANRLTGNLHVEGIVDAGTATFMNGNVPVPAGYDWYPWGAYCGHDHALTAETAAPTGG